MNRIGSGFFDGVQYFFDDDIGLVRRCWSDMDSLVSHFNVKRITIGVGIDGYGCNAHFLCRFDDPAGNFAAIGDKNFLNHGWLLAVSDHKGMVSCFFQGVASCLLRRLAKARAIRRRDECGMITSSIKPRSAATNGFANRSSYSLVRAAILSGSSSSER